MNPAIILRKSFGFCSGKKSRLNLAMSYTINEAVDVVMDIPTLFSGFRWLYRQAPASTLVGPITRQKVMPFFEIYQEIALREIAAAISANSRLFTCKKPIFGSTIVASIRYCALPALKLIVADCPSKISVLLTSAKLPVSTKYLGILMFSKVIVLCCS